MPRIVCKNYEKVEVTVEVDKYPDYCPVCNTGNEFSPMYAHYKKDTYGDSPRVQVLFRCPRKDCQMLFFAFYHDPYPMHHFGGETTLYLQRFTLTQHVEEPEFPDPIPKISPKFVEIYFQANIAEENKLSEISGIAYGKALEFLIKDYLIHLNPDDAENIKKELHLAVLIDRFEDGDIQVVADRASWLRNDEAHYIRKWVEQDIQDLKNLIELTTQHIRRAEMTKAYREKMNPKKAHAAQLQQEQVQQAQADTQVPEVQPED